MLLIIDNDERICKYFPPESIFLNVSKLSLFEALKEIQQHSNKADKIYLTLELKFKDTLRQRLSGLELFNHIRLTPELGALQFAPVVLGHTYSTGRIISQNTFLRTPATDYFNLKNIRQIKNHSFFQPDCNEKLTKALLKPYIHYEKEDEYKNEHDWRNEQGVKKLAREWSGNECNIDLDLWQKKLLFLQLGSKQPSKQSESLVSKEEFNQHIATKRILYLDDEAAKWLPVLEEIFQGSVFESKANYKDIKEFLDKLVKERDALCSTFKKVDEKIWNIVCIKGQRRRIKENLTTEETNKFKNNLKEIDQINNEMTKLLSYDLILLDMRLDKKNDTSKTVDQLSGIEILKKIQEFNPFIPIVVFTASNKIETYRGVMAHNGIGVYEFWTKNISSATDLMNKCVISFINRDKYHLPDIHILNAQIQMIRQKSKCIQFKLRDNKIVPCPLFLKSRDNEKMPNVYGIRIDDTTQLFIQFVQKIMIKGLDEKEDSIRKLWKLTCDSIEIRVPAISKLSIEDIKNIDVDDKIAAKEYDIFRVIRNYCVHSNTLEDCKAKFQNLSNTLDYIEHTINFLFQYH